MRRARLFVSQLEARDNPSVPELDPIGGTNPPPSDPPPAPPGDTVIVTIIDAAGAGAAGAGGTTTTTTGDPLTDTNSIYNIPLIP